MLLALKIKKLEREKAVLRNMNCAISAKTSRFSAG